MSLGAHEFEFGTILQRHVSSLSATSAIKPGGVHVDKELGPYVKCGLLIMASFLVHYYIDC